MLMFALRTPPGKHRRRVSTSRRHSNTRASVRTRVVSVPALVPGPTAGPFGMWAATALASGFEPIPVDGKIPKLSAWPTVDLTPALVGSLTSQPAMANLNMGLRTRQLLAIDIDATDVDRATIIEAMAEKVFGPTPFTRIGNWPKRMLFYRLDVPIASRRVGQVDILSQGKQCVVAGIHPDTGQPYYWPEASLLDASLTDVPLVTEEQVDAFERLVANISGGQVMPGRAINCACNRGKGRNVVIVQKGEAQPRRRQRLAGPAKQPFVL
jgi:hypothetical protein